MISIGEIDIVHNDEHKLAVFTILLAFWFAFYALVHVTYQNKTIKEKTLNDTRNRIVSIFHGVVSFALAATQYFPTGHFNEPNTQFQNFVCLFSLSYCVYDLIACVYFKLADGGLILHHMLCLIGFGSAVMSGYGAMDSLGGLFVAEISNFPMHLRVILRNYGLRYTKLYELSENVYLILYILARGIFCPFFVLYPSILSTHSPIIVKIICFSMTVQSMYYILQMSKIIRKKMKQYREMKQKKVEYNWLSQNQDVKRLSFYQVSDGPKIF